MDHFLMSTVHPFLSPC